MATLECPYSTSQFRAFSEAGRNMYVTLHDELSVIAAELKNELKNVAPGNPLLMGIDTKTNARRVVKPIVHAAQLSLEAAVAMKNAYTVYHGIYVPVRPKDKGGFNIEA